MITPDFIIGLMDSKMQFVSEGAALFVKRIGLDDLIDLRMIAKIIDTDWFFNILLFFIIEILLKFAVSF